VTGCRSILRNGSPRINSPISRSNCAGDDAEWDFQRIISVDRIASAKVRGEPVLLDFMRSVRLAQRWRIAPAGEGDCCAGLPRIGLVEQPTSRERGPSEDKMHEAAKLKPVVIDEALTDYDAFRRARALGYSGVPQACKGIGPSCSCGACRKDGLSLRQDLTCPGLFVVGVHFARGVARRGSDRGKRAEVLSQRECGVGETSSEVFTIREDASRRVDLAEMDWF